MAELYNVGNAINRTERNNLNLTFEDIQKEMSKININVSTVKGRLNDDVTGLQGQINTLVVNGDSSPEAAQARVGEDGHVYNTLKDRLDSENLAIKSEINDIYATPEFYGAKGDGVNDDTLFLQQAISSGYDVRLKGNYKVTSTITITSPVKIVSNGSRIISNTNRIKVFRITSSNVFIDGLKFEGRGNELAYTNESMVTVEGIVGAPYTAPTYIKNVEIKNCSFSNVGYYGVHALYVDNLIVKNNTFNNIGYCGVGLISCKNSNVDYNSIKNITPGAVVGSGVNAYGMFFSQINHDDIVRYPACYNCKAIGNVVDNTPWEGIDTHGGVKLTFKDNEVSNTPVGIAIIDADDQSQNKIRGVQDIIVEGNTVYNCNSAISTSNISGDLRHKNVIIKGNIIKNSGTLNGGSLVIGYVDGCVIEGNVIEESLTSGLLLRGEVNATTVTGNSFVNMYSNSSSSTAYATAIYITRESVNATIHGNTMDSTTNFTALKVNQYGVYIGGSLVYLGLTLGKNDFDSFTVQRYNITANQAALIDSPVTQKGRTTITPTTSVSSVTQAVTLPRAYSGNTLYEAFGSVVSISGSNSLVVALVTKIDVQTISVTVRTVNGTNFTNTGNIVVAWSTEGF